MRAFFVGIGITGALYVWQSGWPNAAAKALTHVTTQFSGRLGLRVSDVLVEGRDRAASSDILSALRVDRGMPILAFDPSAARDRLLQLEWVQGTTVARRLPATIYVQISEYRPIAVWQKDGEFALIDEVGEIIPASSDELLGELPLVVGDGAARHAAELLDTLAAFPDLADRMKAAVWVSGRRWDLHMEEDIEIRLPENRMASALGRLSDLNSQHALFERDVKAVDLRLPNRLILRRGSRAPATAGENT